MSDYTISVVIPTYNRANMVCEAIDSVLAQTYPAHEIIVVDDGSTDDTAHVLNDCYGERIRYIRQKNAGPAAARNHGIEVATGEWIAFQDSDDVWFPKKLERQIGILSEKPRIRMVFTGTEIRNSDLSKLLKQHVIPERIRHDLYFEILKECWVQSPTVVVHQETLKSVGLFNRQLTIGEDWELWSRVAEKYQIDFIAEPLVYVRKHSGSIQADVSRWAEEDLKSMDVMLSRPAAAPYNSLISFHHHRIYSEAGIHFFYEGNKRMARQYFRKSLLCQPDILTACYFAKTFIPAPWLAKARQLRGTNR